MLSKLIYVLKIKGMHEENIKISTNISILLVIIFLFSFLVFQITYKIAIIEIIAFIISILFFSGPPMNMADIIKITIIQMVSILLTIKLVPHFLFGLL